MVSTQKKICAGTFIAMTKCASPNNPDLFKTTKTKNIEAIKFSLTGKKQNSYSL